MRRVTDKDGRAADPSQRSVDCRDVAFEGVLGRYHLVPFRLKRRDQLAEARAIGPDSVSEYDALFCLCHICIRSTLRRHTFWSQNLLR